MTKGSLTAYSLTTTTFKDVNVTDSLLTINHRKINLQHMYPYLHNFEKGYDGSKSYKRTNFCEAYYVKRFISTGCYYAPENTHLIFILIDVGSLF